MKRFTSIMLLTSTLALLALVLVSLPGRSAAAAIVHARPARFARTASPLPGGRCSTRTTEGTYLVVCNGYLSTGPSTPLLPAKLLATATADDGGTFQGVGTLSLGGQILKQTAVGTEQINSDCTGSITYAQTINGAPFPDPLDINFVVSEDGNRIDGISTDPGTVFSCELRRTSRGDSDSAELRTNSAGHSNTQPQRQSR